jgi:hypothetical protein
MFLVLETVDDVVVAAALVDGEILNATVGK